jgi:hypothetical protein
VTGKEVNIMKALFQPGAVVVTPGANDLLKELGFDPSHLLARHITGDWGDLDEQDKEANDIAVLEKGRILSAYGTGASKLWIITEWDRSVTTILRPDEY